MTERYATNFTDVRAFFGTSVADYEISDEFLVNNRFGRLSDADVDLPLVLAEARQQARELHLVDPDRWFIRV